MSKQHEKHYFYRAFLHLYPKLHRLTYGEQMVQTLDDMLSDQHSSLGRFSIWLKIAIELPISAVEENISGLGEISVNKLTKITSKQYLYAFMGVLLTGSYAVLGIMLITQHHQNQILGGRIDVAAQNQHAMNGSGYTAATITPAEHAVYLPLAKLKLTDTPLNEQLVYSYQDARHSPISPKIFPAQVNISTHDLSINNFSSAQFDCSEVVYADFVTPSYAINPMWKSDGSIALTDGRIMNVYYAPSIQGCDQAWKMSGIDSKAIADSLTHAVSY